ncbi:MAG: hypothetical protein WBF89_19880 [Steroidobacteraceae bacterium]
MDASHVLIAGIVSGILANGTGYLITGRLFHHYQARTPATWRRSESWTQYLYSTLLRLLVCVGIAALYAVLAASPAHSWLRPGSGGILLGLCVWAVAVAPVIAEISLFVNWHAGFILGLLLDWLVVCVMASVAAAFFAG